MKLISSNKITDAVISLCAKANFYLSAGVLSLLKSAYHKESNKLAKKALKQIIDNSSIARRESLAICQDTGLPSVFVEIGQNVIIKGEARQAIIRGVESGYRKFSLRNSIVKDPVLRNSPGYAPCVIHFDIVRGSSLKIILIPKGFGCENKTRLKMFKPTAGPQEIKDFIVDTVRQAGPDACPPYIVGVGIGGTADYACLLAKKALLRRITSYLPHRQAGELQVTSYVSKLERNLLKQINKLNIGPMGLGGKTTALAVNIETYPTHIAGLPVCVNVSCHALRGAVATL